MQRDPYEVLGVTRDADEADVKRAFRRLARELHPDVSDSHESEAEFKEAAEAYEILSDPERRRTYDRFGHEGLRSGGYAPSFDGFGSIGDIFDAFFGGGAFGGRRGPVAGDDVVAVAEIDLATAAKGGSVEIAYDAVERCGRCRGNGAEPGTPIETCKRCGGAGRLQATSRTPFGQVVRAVECDVCGGDGRVPADPCRECRWRGHRLGDQTLKVDIPAGIADGQRIRLSGRGHVGEAGAPQGDLYILVRVREDERFVRDGDDLVCVLDVSAPAAALGATLEVDTLDGPVEVDVAPGTQPGEVIVVRGAGMPRLRAASGRGAVRRGDLRVVVNVVVPRRLDRKQRQLLERLGDSLTEDNLRADESLLGKLRRVLRAPAA